MKKSKITEIKWLTHFIISRNKIRVCPPVAFTPTESNTFLLVCLVPDLYVKSTWLLQRFACTFAGLRDAVAWVKGGLWRRVTFLAQRHSQILQRREGAGVAPGSSRGFVGCLWSKVGVTRGGYVAVLLKLKLSRPQFRRTALQLISDLNAKLSYNRKAGGGGSRV